MTESQRAPRLLESGLPRYFFHISDSVVIPDQDGTLLHDDAAARVEAVVVAGAMLRDHAAKFWASGELKVIVTDEKHAVLFTICCQALAAPCPPLDYAPQHGA